MNATDLTHAPEPPVAHPLAAELALILDAALGPARVLVLGAGSGRNLPILLASGAEVFVLDEDPQRVRDVAKRFSPGNLRSAHGSYAAAFPFAAGFAGVLSTHALLHGSPTSVAAALAAVRAALRPGGRFFTTLGSRRDPRYGTGLRVAENTFAAEAGPEAGVPHVFFDEAAVRRLFIDFELDALQEACAAETAGRWAHSEQEASTIVHWFVRARARA